MPLTRSLIRIAPFAVFTAVILGPSHGPAAAPAPTSPPGSAAAPSSPAEVEVRYVDDSVMKLKLLDERLDLHTRYGTLSIPTADIRKIDFAARVPPDVADKITAAVGRLGHPDFQTREKASSELKDYRERAFPTLLKATKHSDPEVSRRAEEAIRYLQVKLPASQLEPRKYDVIHTDDSKITGELKLDSLRVLTFQFGEQRLRLADVRALRAGVAVADDAVAAGPAPTNLTAYQNQFGKELTFSVTGASTTGQSAGVWGTDVYTLDSNLSAAAVHAGVLQPGQTGPVRVRIVQSPPQFVGSFKNGIGSAPYANYPAGGFEFMRR
jgi:hypothetical protein